MMIMANSLCIMCSSEADKYKSSKDKFILGESTCNNYIDKCKVFLENVKSLTNFLSENKANSDYLKKMDTFKNSVSDKSSFWTQVQKLEDNKSSQNGRNQICEESINVQDNLPLYLDESEINKFIRSGHRNRRLLIAASSNQLKGSIDVYDHTSLETDYNDQIFDGEFN